MTITAAELVAKISVQGGPQAKQDLEGVGTAVQGAGSKLGLLAGGIALAAGAALVGLGAKSVKMAGDFQESMTQLVTGAGESTANLKMVSDGILKIAVSTATGTKDLSSAMFLVESSGYRGAQALQVLQTAAQGAKVQHADLTQTTDVLTTALHDYRLSASQAVPVMNSLATTVSNGKMHMDDLNASLTTILPVSGVLKIKLSDVEGALSAMAIGGDKGAAAGTHLAMMLKVLAQPASSASKEMAKMGINSVDLANTMRTSLPGALQMIQDAVAKHFVPGSVEYNRAISTILGGSKSGIAGLELMGQNLKLFQGDAAAAAAAAAHAGSAVQGWADVQKDWNFKLGKAKEVLETFGIKIGTALLPVLGKVVDFLTGPALSGLEKFGNIIGGVIGPAVTQAKQAFDSLFLPVQKLQGAAKPLLDTFDRSDQVIRNLTPAVKPLTDNFDRCTQILGNFAPKAKGAGDAINPLVPIFRQVVDTLMGLGKAAMNMDPLVNTIEGVARHGKDLGQWWQASVIPALKQAEPGFKNLGQALAGLLPAFEQIAQVVHNNFQKSFDAMLPVFKQVVPLVIQLAGSLAGGLGTAIKTLTPYVVQAATAIAQFGSDIATRVAPIVKGFFDELNKDMPGLKALWNTIWPSLSMSLQAAWNAITTTVKVAWDIVTGIIKVGLDVMSGNWKQAWEDVKTTFENLWNDIKGYFINAWNIMKGQVQDGVDKVKAQFQGLYDALVGHSIVPDMINGIISWFQQLPGRAGAAIQDMVNRVTGLLNGLASSAFTSGAKVVNSVADGIRSAIGNVTGAISSVAQAIADHLPHSPAKRGPLSKLNEFGLALVKTFADDITKNSPRAHAAAEHLARQTADQLKAFPREIAQARLDGNTALVKSLEAARHQDELLMRDFKDELTIHGDRWSALHGIIFGGTAAHHAATKGKHAIGSGAVGSLANNGARAFVGRGGERLNFSGSGASGSVSGGSGSGGSTSRTASGQPVEIILNIDGKRVAKAIIPDIVMLIRNGTGTLL